MPRPIRATTPVFAGDDASQREASTLWGGMTVYTDDRLQPGFVRAGIDDPQYFALHPSGVIPVSREMAYGEAAPDPSPARGGRVQWEWMDEAAYDADLIDWWVSTPAEVEPYERRDRARQNDGPSLSAINWFDAELNRPVRHDQEPAADHRHAWAVTAMHMDGGVRFDLGCAHCDAVHRNVHRDRMERLIDSNTAPDPAPVDPGLRPERIRDTDVVLGGHRLPTERWNEGGYERTLFRVEGFRQDGERVASQRSLQISDQAGRDPGHAQTIRQRIIAQLVDECERLGMLRDERVCISERPW